MPAEERDEEVTHAFVVAWFVARALDAPPADWMLLPAADAGITVLALRSHGDFAVISFNDVAHLSLDGG
ncbi:hypothetical protein ACEXQE_19220 [Herbiconiux sp. P17]|uniref:hypothetical protein n=1 Tax=Herbiconiux wuyangfengii TaxID=3342794 RepID=UPI0035B94788